jgi:hypothetical protein
LVDELTAVFVAGNGTRAHDLTTFVSATGPGTQPQIIRKSNGGQKKDVQIQDAKGWAALSRGAAKIDTNNMERGESDALWKEFKGKEQEQKVLKEQRKALEEEAARKKKVAEEEVLRMAEEEERKKREAEEQRVAESKRKEEELRRQEAEELEAMNAKAKEDAELDMMKQAGHGGGEDDHLDDLGLADAGDDASDDEEEAMDI